MNMKKYMKKLLTVKVFKQKCEHTSDLWTSAKLKSFQASAGTRNRLCDDSLPQASLLSSYFQQNVQWLKVEDLLAANKIVAELEKLHSIIRQKSVQNVDYLVYLGFSDASQEKSSYKQTRYVSGLCSDGQRKYIFNLSIRWVINIVKNWKQCTTLLSSV